MNAEAWQAWIAGAAVIFALGGFCVGLITAMQARVRELESFYFERYWQMIEEACILYLRLCEEEGMAYQLRTPPVREEWHKIRDEVARREAAGEECRRFRLLRQYGPVTDPSGDGDPLDASLVGWLRGAHSARDALPVPESRQDDTADSGR
ncbi:hypothetical protein AB0H77_06080 [Streptomyces sp. NPDC050844]|uniref:hypothetical protein n=1 Tax=Streptomyces sp. NPDC050844 TaxID=3155790 RepID=UPI0033E2CAF7